MYVLGICNIWSVTNYSVYFESHQYEWRLNTEIFNLVNYLFFSENIHSKIWQIVVPHFYDCFNIKPIVYHFHSQILQILNLLSKIWIIYLWINMVKFDVDWEITKTYKN